MNETISYVCAGQTRMRAQIGMTGKNPLYCRHYRQNKAYFATDYPFNRENRKHLKVGIK